MESMGRMGNGKNGKWEMGNGEWEMGSMENEKNGVDNG